MSDKFWYDDYTILYDKNRIIEFIPSQNMTLIEKLNALVRFSIYLSLLLYIYNRRYVVFYIPIIICVITLLLNNYESFLNIEKYNNNTKKTLTTKNNPFMNVLITDYNKNPNRDAAPIYYNNKNIKREVNNNFNSNLYRDIGDIFQKNNSQREFYTMPNTKIPNDQKSFAEWCYKDTKSCKEGSANKCEKNIMRDLRI